MNVKYILAAFIILISVTGCSSTMPDEPDNVLFKTVITNRDSESINGVSIKVLKAYADVNGHEAYMDFRGILVSNSSGTISINIDCTSYFYDFRIVMYNENGTEIPLSLDETIYRPGRLKGHQKKVMDAWRKELFDREPYKPYIDRKRISIPMLKPPHLEYPGSSTPCIFQPIIKYEDENRIEPGEKRWILKFLLYNDSFKSIETFKAQIIWDPDSDGKLHGLKSNSVIFKRSGEGLDIMEYLNMPPVIQWPEYKIRPKQLYKHNRE